MNSDKPTAEEVAIFSSGNNKSPADIRFIHYNDVYHIDSSSAEPVGGIARFQSLVNYYRNDAKFNDQPKLLNFFSGDAFNPSTESSVTKGSHMVPFLNNLQTDVACVGNHDLDFGVTQFCNLAGQCKFPWLLANVLDPALGDNVPLGNAQRTTILTASNGIKIGVIGLAEREWLDTINTLPPNLIYNSASATAKELVPGLREQGAELIVALTHQREPNDNKLAEKIPKGLIDIILGGHDHFYGHSLINGTHVLRSGTDFKQLSYIEARRKQDSNEGWDIDIIRRDVVSSIPEDPETIKLVEGVTDALKARLGKAIGYVAAPLDARFTTVRLKESNYGNFVCDLMRHHYNADCCIMASGTIRGDQIYPPGILKLKDVMDCFPFEDPCVVLRVKGKAIIAALENAVSKYPALEGRFPQVSNIEMEFDPKRAEGSRLTSVRISGGPVDLEKDYDLATRGYMGHGKDGYESLLIKSKGGEAEEVVSEENGILISTLLRLYFLSLKVFGRWRHWCNDVGHHYAHVQEKLHESHPIVEPQVPSKEAVEEFRKAVNEEAKDSKATNSNADHHELPSHHESDDENSDLKAVPTHVSQRERELVIMRKVMRKWWRLTGLSGHPQMCDELSEGEFTVHWTRAVAPRLEGRIKVVSSGEGK
ncbi:5'-nucleotidase [Rhizodiscina lignyota]|uniref:5'-nucleotidase n=1 Tax=Rhizodiscina lignyota TaxID=1504668 RepID=A0A9P4IJZ7_9PEZI|nr:5'-nucleotidase [Rhizodiscina lignyota]